MPAIVDLVEMHLTREDISTVDAIRPQLGIKDSTPIEIVGQSEEEIGTRPHPSQRFVERDLRNSLSLEK